MRIKINSFANSELCKPIGWKHIFAEIDKDYFLYVKDSQNVYQEICDFVKRYTADLIDNTPLNLNFGVCDDVIERLSDDVSIIIGQCCVERKSYGAIAVVNNDSVIYQYIEKGD